MTARRIPYRDLAWRAVGASAIVVAGGSVRLLHAVAASDWGASIVFWSLALELSAFVLAILGVLLLVGGAKWHDRWGLGLIETPSSGDASDTRSKMAINADAEPMADRYIGSDGTRETAMVLAGRAIEAAAALKQRSASRTNVISQRFRGDRRRPRAFRSHV